MVAAQTPEGREALIDRMLSGDRRAMPAIVKQGDAILPELIKVLGNRPRDDRQSLLLLAMAAPKQKGRRRSFVNC
jgi:hypothetical protein